MTSNLIDKLWGTTLVAGLAACGYLAMGIAETKAEMRSRQPRQTSSLEQKVDYNPSLTISDLADSTVLTDSASSTNMPYADSFDSTEERNYVPINPLVKPLESAVEQVALPKTQAAKKAYFKNLAAKNVTQYCSNYPQITSNLVTALVEAESSFNKDANSRVGARGAMQLMPKTWEQTTEKIHGQALPFSEAYNPEENVEAGINYLITIHNYLSRKLSGYKNSTPKDQKQALVAAYNGGPGRLAKLGSIDKMPGESKEHVKKVGQFGGYD